MRLQIKQFLVFLKEEMVLLTCPHHKQTFAFHNFFSPKSNDCCAVAARPTPSTTSAQAFINCWKTGVWGEAASE